MICFILLESQTGAATVIQVYIGIFLAATGGYAIIHSLQQLGKQRADSSLGIKSFKISAPAGFIYGIASFLIILAMVLYPEFIDYKKKNVLLEEQYFRIRVQNDSLKLICKTQEKKLQANSDTVLKVNLFSGAPKSISRGKILLVATKISPTYWDLSAKGAQGLSLNLRGPFTLNSIGIFKGSRIFMRLENNEVWGINTIDVKDSASLELFKE